MWRAKKWLEIPVPNGSQDDGHGGIFPLKWWILQRGDSVTGVLLAEDGSRLRTETDGFILVDEQ